MKITTLEASSVLGIKPKSIMILSTKKKNLYINAKVGRAKYSLGKLLLIEDSMKHVENPKSKLGRTFITFIRDNKYISGTKMSNDILCHLTQINEPTVYVAKRAVDLYLKDYQDEFKTSDYNYLGVLEEYLEYKQIIKEVKNGKCAELSRCIGIFRNKL